MNPTDRMSFSLSLVGVGAVLLLAPLLCHVYMANRHQERLFEYRKGHANAYMDSDTKSAWGGTAGEAFFVFAGLGSFGAGALIAGLGLWGARSMFFGPKAAPAPAEQASTLALAETRSLGAPT